MSFKKLASLLLSAASAVCMTATASNAQSASTTMSGVAFGGSSKATSTLITPDPVYRLYQSFLVNTYKLRFDCGWNLPEIGKGNNALPDVGGLEYFEFYYEVPNLGPSADQGLVVVIQTAEGFSRVAGVTSSKPFAQNGYNAYHVTLTPQNFIPAFNSDEKVVRTATVRYNGAIGPIYLTYPLIWGQKSVLSWTDFSAKALPDPTFVNR